MFAVGAAKHFSGIGAATRRLAASAGRERTRTSDATIFESGEFKTPKSVRHKKRGGESENAIMCERISENTNAGRGGTTTG